MFAGRLFERPRSRQCFCRHGLRAPWKAPASVSSPKTSKETPMRKPKRVKKQKFPAGWDEAKIWRLARYYDNLNENEQLAEYERALNAEGHTMMSVPLRLVPAVRELIASAQKIRRKRT